MTSYRISYEHQAPPVSLPAPGGCLGEETAFDRFRYYNWKTRPPGEVYWDTRAGCWVCCEPPADQPGVSGE